MYLKRKEKQTVKLLTKLWAANFSYSFQTSLQTRLPGSTLTSFQFYLQICPIVWTIVFVDEISPFAGRYDQ